jgi:hypothetical protein
MSSPSSPNFEEIREYLKYSLMIINNKFTPIKTAIRIRTDLWTFLSTPQGVTFMTEVPRLVKTILNKLRELNSLPISVEYPSLSNREHIIARRLMLMLQMIESDQETGVSVAPR